MYKHVEVVRSCHHFKCLSMHSLLPITLFITNFYNSMLLLKRPQKSLFRSPQFNLLRLPSGSICISALVTRTDGCAIHDSFQIKTMSFQNTGLWLSVLLHIWNRCFDRAATCGGAPSRWAASTAVWCLDTHRTSVSLVFQNQTLLPWMQWQRDVITLSLRERQGGREFKVIITFAVTTQWQRWGCMPLIVGSVCISAMSNCRSEDHLFMSLHL